jgi:hypothetical protein
LARWAWQNWRKLLSGSRMCDRELWRSLTKLAGRYRRL